MFLDLFIYFFILFFYLQIFNVFNLRVVYFFYFSLFYFINFSIYNNIFFYFIFSFFWVFLIFIINTSLKNKKVLSIILFTVALILISSLLILLSNYIFLIIIGFEIMLLCSLLLLKLTIKTDRGYEAILEMFLWGFIGSFFLIISLVLNYVFFFLFNKSNINIIDLFLFLGFSIKIPLWPFTSWLLKAHTEASTEFSIFLSGFLVKFGVISLYKILLISNSLLLYNIIFFLSVLGIIDACLKLVIQVDLKKIVALMTIVETNWLALCFSTNLNIFNNVGFLILFIHTLTTTIEFFLVDILYKRYNTRNYLNINSLNSNYPLISVFYLISTLIIIGLPGTSIFLLKFIFLMNLLSYNIYIYFIISFFFLIFLPIFFIKLYLSITSGISVKNKINNKNLFLDLSKKEFFILILPVFLNLIFGFLPNILI